MRVLGLVLLVVGLVGLVFGILAAIGTPVGSVAQGYATWRGAGPIIAGLGLTGIGAYLALARV